MKDNLHQNLEDGPGFICRLAVDVIDRFGLDDHEDVDAFKAEADIFMRYPTLQAGPVVNIYALLETASGDLIDIVTEIAGSPSHIEGLPLLPDRFWRCVGFAFVPDSEIKRCYGRIEDVEDLVIQDIIAELSAMFRIRQQPEFDFGPSPFAS